MKFFIALFVICGPLSIHAMNDDKKIGGGISGAQKKVSNVEIDEPIILPHGAGLISQWHQRRSKTIDQNEQQDQRSYGPSSLKKSTDMLPAV